jgi:fructose-specific phosphotransferase system component IIB
MAWPFTRNKPAEQRQKEQSTAPAPEIRPARAEMSFLAQAARIAPHVFQAWKTLCAQENTTTVKRLRDLMRSETEDMGGEGDPVEFASICQQMGVPPAHRAVELMERDLVQHGHEIPAPAPAPGSVQPAVTDAIRRANKEIDDSFTAAEVAREMGVKVQELSTQFLGQVADLTVALSDVSAKYGEMVRKFQNAPDFNNWAVKLEQAIGAIGAISKQQQEIIDRAEMIIANQNTITEVFKKFNDTAVSSIINNVVGRLGEHLDEKTKLLQHLPVLLEVRKTMVNLIETHNQIIDILERKLGQPAQQTTTRR